jgi:hypothetical protein
VTFKEAQEMPYLQAVIKEILRMHPAVGTILPRLVPKGGATLAGVYLPEGVSHFTVQFLPSLTFDAQTAVGACAWALHFSKDIDADNTGRSVGLRLTSQD